MKSSTGAPSVFYFCMTELFSPASARTCVVADIGNLSVNPVRSIHDGSL
ncbi:hypothetical protein N6P31_18350 [Pectobacterium betavasculorum]